MLAIEDLMNFSYKFEKFQEMNTTLNLCGMHYVDDMGAHEGKITLTKHRTETLKKNAQAIIAMCDQIIG